MVSIYFYIFILLLALYLAFRYAKRNKEGFALVRKGTLNDESYYVTAWNYNDIFDDLYVFLYDNLCFDHTRCAETSAALITQTGSIYNNILIVGIKHNGTLVNTLIQEKNKSQDMDNILKCTAISSSNSVTQYCKYSFPELSKCFACCGAKASDPYYYEQGEFTHIMLADDELYYTSNASEILYNCSEWLCHKGKLLIDVYNSEQGFVESYSPRTSQRGFERLIYESNVKEISPREYIFVERITNKVLGKQRVNNHELHWISVDDIEYICREFGLVLSERLNTGENTSVLVFQKRE